MLIKKIKNVCVISFTSVIYLLTKILIDESTCVDTTQQNGVVERKNHDLFEVAKVTILFQMSVPESYWGEAVLIATYLINCVLSRVIDNVSLVQFLILRSPFVPIL